MRLWPIAEKTINLASVMTGTDVNCISDPVAVPANALYAIEGDWEREYSVSCDNVLFTPLRKGMILPPSDTGFLYFKREVAGNNPGGWVRIVSWPIDSAPFLNFDTTRVNAHVNTSARAPLINPRSKRAFPGSEYDQSLVGDSYAVTDAGVFVDLNPGLYAFVADGDKVYLCNEDSPTTKVIYLPDGVPHHFEVGGDPNPNIMTTLSAVTNTGATATLYVYELG